MNKLKLAICMKDLEYQARFVNCFMNHYKHLYELHVFTNIEQLKKVAPQEYAVIITGEFNTDELTFFVEKGEIILNLLEEYTEMEDTVVNNVIPADKYQEVYKIAEIIERLTADKVSAQSGISQVSCEHIGIYSLTQEVYQIPVAALLGKICGEQQKVLVLDLQSYSGLKEIEGEESPMGLEDLLSVIATGNYSRSRILECIRHEANWDYVCAVQNSQCLAEATIEAYNALIELLVREFGYQKVIINFGAVFWGQLDMMEQCQSIYILCGKDSLGYWREDAFYQELAHMGREKLLRNIKKLELPQIAEKEITWRFLVEKWNCGYMGELLRNTMEKRCANGAAM